MSFYQEFNIVRLEPDTRSLFNTIRGLDATAGIWHSPGTPRYVIKKETPWTGPQITAATNVITNAPNMSSRLSAQADIDDFPIAMRALILALVDEINELRAAAGLTPPRTPAGALQAIRNKAATL